MYVCAPADRSRTILINSAQYGHLIVHSGSQVVMSLRNSGLQARADPGGHIELVFGRPDEFPFPRATVMNSVLAFNP